MLPVIRLECSASSSVTSFCLNVKTEVDTLNTASRGDEEGDLQVCSFISAFNIEPY